MFPTLNCLFSCLVFHHVTWIILFLGEVVAVSNMVLPQEKCDLCQKNKKGAPNTKNKLIYLLPPLSPPDDVTETLFCLHRYWSWFLKHSQVTLCMRWTHVKQNQHQAAGHHRQFMLNFSVRLGNLWPVLLLMLRTGRGNNTGSIPLLERVRSVDTADVWRITPFIRGTAFLICVPVTYKQLCGF